VNVPICRKRDKVLTGTIYAIINTVTGARYIGATGQLLSLRCCGHRGLLNRGRHWIQLLQRDWESFGPDAFTVEVLEPVTPDLLTEREQYWVGRYLASGVVLYNRRPHHRYSLVY
jgi:hypothetical protein